MKSNIWYHILAVIVAGIWGATFISSKILLFNGLTPINIFFLRFLIAYIGICLLCTTHKSSRKFFAGNVKDELLFIFLGITGGSLYFYTENTALSYTLACNVSFIVCLAPLLTTLLTLFVKSFFKGTLAGGLEDIKGRWTLVLGTIFAIAGVIAVIFDGNEFSFSALGCILAFAAALCWAFYSIIMGQMTKSYGTLFSTRKVFFYGLLTAVPFLTFNGNIPFEKPEVWGNLLFLSLVASLICYVLWNKILSKIGNVTATNYVYLNPFMTLLFGVLILSESLTIQSAFGCLSIVAGVIIGGLKPHFYK